jgi:hypothetical protein
MKCEQICENAVFHKIRDLIFSHFKSRVPAFIVTGQSHEFSTNTFSVWAPKLKLLAKIPPI